MQSVIAYEKVTTRTRPTPPQTCIRPAPQVLTTHAGICPRCHREAHIGLGSIAIIYGGCHHLRGVDQHGISVSILFDEAFTSTVDPARLVNERVNAYK